MIALGRRWKELTAGIVTAVRRFPLPLAAGAAGAITGVIYVGVDASSAGDTALRVLMIAWLGVALFLAAALAGDKSAKHRAWPSVAAAALLAGCYAALGGQEEWVYIRFALFLIAALALLALVPLARPAPRGDFRPFNLMLFARTSLALLLTHVLWAGLCFALAAVEHLFDLQVPNRIYPQLWFVLLGVFNLAYVLAGIPRDWDRLEGQLETPRPLDVLARHVLLPLSLLYLGILYVYSVKIIVVHTWPRGWVSAPIIVFAAVGMLTVLLLDAGRLTGSRLVRAYCRGFFVALLPLVLLLILAISRRAFEYGLTEERCLVYAIAAFLAVIAPYFILARRRNLAAIPLVLAGIAVVTAVGPLSGRSLSVRSQTARLRGLLERNDRLTGGVLTRSARAVSRREEHEIGAALDYLESRQALGPVLAWRSTDASCSRRAALADATTGREIAAALGIAYRPQRYSDEAIASTRRTAAQPVALETAGFDFVFPAIGCWSNDGTCELGGRLAADWTARLEGTELLVDHLGATVARIALADLERAAPKGDNRPAPGEPLVQEGRWNGERYRLFVSLIAFDRPDEGSPARITNLSGVLLLGASR